MSALCHHDEMHKLVENYLWMIQLERRQKGMEAESSLDSLQMIREGMRTTRTNYLHLLLDHGHLLNLVEIYSNALRRKEEEIDDLFLQLSMAHSSLHKVEKTIADPSVIHEYDAITLEIKQIIEGIDEIYKYEMTHNDLSTHPINLNLQFGEEHVGYSFPAPSSWVFPPITLIDSFSTMLIRIISGCTLREAAMDMDRRDWDCHFGVSECRNGEFLPSLGGRDTLHSIMHMVYWLHGAVLIYASSLIGVGVCFYAPMMGTIHTYSRPLWVDWIIDDLDTSDLVTGLSNNVELGIHDAIILPTLICESSFVVASTEWYSHDHFDTPLMQAGVFHFDYIVRCAY